MIKKYIKALVEYGLSKGLITTQDKIYSTNLLLDLFQVDEYDETAVFEQLPNTLEEILEGMLNYACELGILKEQSIVYRDLFDTKIMGLLIPKPSEVIHKFKTYYEENPIKATDYFYQFSQDTDYIRRYRIEKDLKWVTKTVYGDLDITINLSKPEKDPKAIAEAKNMKQSGYPKCLLCKENEGYAGRINHPARQNHRIIPVRIHNQDWGFQYSPYVYYNEHCIVFHSEHTPMEIGRETFCKLFDFVKQFPHYFVGSNADLPIVGGSILTHDHFQGGRYEFAMAKAPIKKEVTIKGFEKVKVGIVKWPMSVIRLKGEEAQTLVELGEFILKKWRNYTDEDSFVYSYSHKNGKLVTKEKALTSTALELKEYEPHNTVTPIARKRDGFYELDLVLRNNVTTEEHPFGLYHPHKELHHIKKENIGLIEVMGLAVLPSRLKAEMEILKEYILKGQEVTSNEEIEKHKDWVKEILRKYPSVEEADLDAVIKKEIGLVFSKVLEHAGVYKQDEKGEKGFYRFISFLNS